VPQTEAIASGLNINLNSRIYFLDSNLSLFEIYKFQPEDATYTQLKIGDANSTDLSNKTKFIWERRSNLSKIHLNLTYLQNHPFIMKEKGSLKVDGFFGEIFYILQENLGFHYTLHNLKENIYGSIQVNGSYNGILGEIQKGKINWSISDMTLSLTRDQEFDFSNPIFYQDKKIVTRKPAEDFDKSAYFVVFSQNFWIALFVSAVVLIFTLYWILRLDSVDDKYQSNRLAAAFSFIMLSLFGKGISPLDASWSGKILFLVILFWGFIVSISYNAILTSVLASSKTSQPIDSLEEMLDSPQYTLVFKPTGVVAEFFQSAPESSVGKIIIL
jgi:hypothetical protein